MDLIDRAQLQEERARDAALARYTQQRTASCAVVERSTGDCDDCGTEIDPRRLAALPMARCCIACQLRRDAAAKLRR